MKIYDVENRERLSVIVHSMEIAPHKPPIQLALSDEDYHALNRAKGLRLTVNPAAVCGKCLDGSMWHKPKPPEPKPTSGKPKARRSTRTVSVPKQAAEPKSGSK